MLGVELEHELNESARETSAVAHENREARSRQLARSLEVENPEIGADVPVGLRFEVELGLVPPGANDDVVVARSTDGHDRIGNVRDAEQRVGDASLDVGDLLLELLDLVRQLAERLALRLKFG